MQAHRDLTQGPILGHILRMALPMMIGMTAHLLVSIVDGIFVGRLGLHEGMAVLNYGFPFFYLAFAILNGMGTGASSILARLLGANEREKAEKTLSQVAWIALGLVVAFIALYPVALPLYLKAQGASPEASALTWHYLNAAVPGLFFTALSLIWGAGLRAEGDTRTLMNGMMIATAVNLIAAPFLIYGDFKFAGLNLHGFSLGVVGAGLATSMANMATALFIGAAYFRKKAALRFRWKTTWDDASGAREAIRVGFPSILSQTLIGINLAVMTFMANRFGEHGVAAVGIGLRLDTLSIFPSLAVMVAVLSLVGQNYGAKKFDRVEETVRKGLACAFVLLLGVGILVKLLQAPIVGLFKPTAETAGPAIHFLGCLALGYPFVGLAVVASGAFQGLGRGVPFLSLTVLRLVLLSIPAAYFLSVKFGESGFHYASPLSALFAGIVASIWILSAARALRKSQPVIP